MPRIATTAEIQDCASAFNYQSIKEGWYVRRWIKAERKYRIKRIPGAETKEQALATFYKSLAEMDTNNSQPDKQPCSAMFSSVVLASSCSTLIMLDIN